MIKVLIISSLALISFSCKKEKYSDIGIITGYDYQKCYGCCGGFYININRTTYLVDPITSKIDLNPQTANYPFYLQLNWNQLSKCNGKYIQVTDYKKIN